jgi:signal transduction histidine kinase
MTSSELRPDDDLLVVNRWLCVSRLRSAGGVALFCVAIDTAGITSIALVPVLTICAVAAAFSLVVMRNPTAVGAPRSLYHLQGTFDLVAVTIGIAVGTEGVTALVFRALFVLVIVPISLVSVAGGLAIATATAVAHLVLLAVDRGMSVDTFASVEATVPIFLFYAVAHQCMFYATRLEQKNQELANTTATLRASQKRLSGLVEVARKISSSADAQSLLGGVNAAALSHLNADWAGTFLVDSKAGTFRPAVRSAMLLEPLAGAAADVPLEALPFLTTLRYQPIVRLGPEELANYPATVVDGKPMGHFLFAGLRCDDQLIGILGVGYQEGHEDRADEGVRELGSIVEHASAALRNRQLLEEAQQASRLKTEFLSTVSHELRTPLNVILGYTEMLRDGTAGALNESQEELFERIDVQAHDLYDLIEATLQVGRMTTAQADLQLVQVPLAELVSSLATATARLPMSPAVALVWEPPDDARGTVLTDPGNVRLVVRNLLSNAFKFTDRGTVTVRIRGEQSHLVIEVADTGPGIAGEDFATVFEMFRQLDSAHGKRASGVGLGLYIVKQIVDRLGGVVDLESTPGRGTTFTLRLPGFDPGDGGATPRRISPSGL